MGNKQSKSYPRYKYNANGEGDNQTVQSREDFERRWAVFMQSLDVGPERVRQIEELDPKQKQELLSNFESNNPKCSAFHYVTLIKGLRSGRVGQSTSKKKDEGQNVRAVLSDTEISLRTNNVDWVYDFLNHQGLDVLIDYMSKTIYTLLRCGEFSAASTLPHIRPGVPSMPGTSGPPPGELGVPHDLRSSSRNKSLPRSSRPPPGITDAIRDSLHLGLKCFRAILNNQRGCALSFEHSDAINVVTLCLLHPSYQTKTLVLELLAAVCLIVGGHDKVLKAFDNFKAVTNESRRFETLMYYFSEHETLSLDDYSIDYMVSCMQFINIVVHSVDQDINLRVFLQHEFKILGLEDFLQKLKERPGDRLNSQGDAYVDNLVDVSVLLEDSEAKEAYAAENERLERELTQVQDQLETLEEETASRMTQLQQRLAVMQAEIFNFKAREDEQKSIMATLQHRIDDMDRSASDREKDLEKQIQELNEQLKQSKEAEAAAQIKLDELVDQLDTLRLPRQHSTNPFIVEDGQVEGAGAQPAMTNGAPDSQPLPNVSFFSSSPGNAPPVPPHRHGSSHAYENMSMTLPARSTIQTKYKLPPVNWALLRPQNLKGTLFEKAENLELQKKIDFDKFEDLFKLDEDSSPRPRVLISEKSPCSRPPNKNSLMDEGRRLCVNALLNFLESERLTMDLLKRSVEAMALSQDVSERVLALAPTPEEVARYQEFAESRSAEEVQKELSDEDLLMLYLCKMDRLTNRLKIILYMTSFDEIWKAVQTKIRVVATASAAVRKSLQLKKILELILLFGNYINSSRRGIAYGFRLQSLDLLMETKSNNKNWTLLHYIVYTIQQSFPDLLCFYDELSCVEEAAKIPMDSIASEVTSLCGGMNLAINELNTMGPAVAPPVLTEFVRTHQHRTEHLRAEADSARTLFLQTAEWFGEKYAGASPDLLFGVLVRFINNFKKAVSDNDKRQRNNEGGHGDSKDGHVRRKERKEPKTQDAKKQSRRKKNRTRQINADGMMDEIMAGLGSEPLQAEVHRRKKHREDP